MKTSLLKLKMVESKRTWWIVTGLVGVGMGIAVMQPNALKTAFRLPQIAPYPYPIPEPSVSKNGSVKALTGADKLYSEALENIERARKTHNRDDYDRAQAIAVKLAGSYPMLKSKSKRILAEVAQARHQFKTAIGFGEELLRKDPSDKILALLSTSHLGLGDFVKARTYAEALVELRPVFENYALLGLVKMSSGQLESAREDFETALHLEDIDAIEDSVWLRNLWAKYYLSTGNLNASESVLKEALRLKENDSMALSLLAQCQAARGNWKKAEELSLAAYNASKETHYLIDQMVYAKKLGDATRASAMANSIEKMMRKEIAENPYAHRLELVEFLLERGHQSDVGEALSLAKSEEKTRQNPETLFYLGTALYRAGHLEEARATVNRLVESGSKDEKYAELTTLVNLAY